MSPENPSMRYVISLQCQLTKIIIAQPIANKEAKPLLKQ